MACAFGEVSAWPPCRPMSCCQLSATASQLLTTTNNNNDDDNSTLPHQLRHQTRRSVCVVEDLVVTLSLSLSLSLSLLRGRLLLARTHAMREVVMAEWDGESCTNGTQLLSTTETARRCRRRARGSVKATPEHSSRERQKCDGVRYGVVFSGKGSSTRHKRRQL